MGVITLVLGGIKCGKTHYAEMQALKKQSTGGDIVYFATAEAHDEEMKQRITRHQLDRPKNWKTVEEPLELKKAFMELDKDYDLILLDCLTLWITNKLGKAGEEYNREEIIETIISDFLSFLDIIKSSKSDLVIVSNQAELGLISQYKLGRLFQDITGLLHQKIAVYAENVIVLQAGLPLAIKGKI